MEFPTEYTGSGRDEPYSWNGCLPSSEATFVMVTWALLGHQPNVK